MSQELSIYPAAPAGIPRGLVQPTLRYRVLVIAVLLSLLLFVVLYLALVAASAYFAYWSVTYPMGAVNRGTILLKAGLVAISVMLFLFLLKGLFKSQHVNTDNYVPLREEDHPALFAFIRQLCRDTGAPFPRQVYVNLEVNAAVFYDSSLLSLILPVRKNLLIGLGLVNMLDLNEFKAVLAHEFGHFSQSSMKVGSYVYTTNRIITDMVYGRDSWDNLLRDWQNAEVGLAIFGWGLGGIVWGLRQVLSGIFRVINLGNLALSRQMEFNADLVAVSVTGSDALIHALAKLDFASQTLMQACKDLQDASDHQLYSADMFYHQTKAAPFVRSLRKDPRLGTAPELPADPAARVQVFQPGDTGIPTMWATHPSNFDREENAKRQYFRSSHDERSPWDLFGAGGGPFLRRSLTQDWYRTWTEPHKPLPLAAPEEVQAFIDEEHAETTYDAKYQGLHDDRFLEPGDLTTVPHEPPIPAETLSERRERLYGPELAATMESYRQRLGEFDVLSGLCNGAMSLNKATLTFRGREHLPEDFERLFKVVDAELAGDRERLAKVDREALLVHHQMATALGDGSAAELLTRYRHHVAQQAFFREMNVQRVQVNGMLQYLSTGPQLSEGDMGQLVATFRQARQALGNALRDARGMTLPKLKNMRGGENLAELLLEDRLVADIPAESLGLDGDWIASFLKQLALVQDRLRRMHFKSMGGILALQEQIAARWQTGMAVPPHVQTQTGMPASPIE